MCGVYACVWYALYVWYVYVCICVCMCERASYRMYYERACAIRHIYLHAAHLHQRANGLVFFGDGIDNDAHRHTSRVNGTTAQ